MRIITDKKDIQDWMDEYGGMPAILRGSRENGSLGIAAIRFNNEDANLEPVSWEEFFDVLDHSNLALQFGEDVIEGVRNPQYEFIDVSDIGEELLSQDDIPEENEIAEENMYSSAPPDPLEDPEYGGA